jgi:hypothetical protein
MKYSCVEGLTMTRQEAVNWINASTKIFAIKFVKRSDNTLRLMNCRRKVLNRLKGGGRAYSEASANIITVFDMAFGGTGYRSVPIEGIRELEINGVWVPVT